MEALGGILIGTQLIFTIIAGIYFYTNLKVQQSARGGRSLESKKEMDKLKKMRSISLTVPLAEKTRPTTFEEIIGQEKGIKALQASICGPNPQHVIIYGPPGVGKTAAARILLQTAIKSKNSPFGSQAPFIEMDATILQFDERSIADPLIGSVHDPIYQGAGAYGQAGVPQPKEGAVTKAHGGILFLDEIGELHSVQMNKLLKVLEDRKVFLSSSYYSREDDNIPKHIHDIFENGLPADFRLIGATTRNPEEIPSALRSRCTEVFFKALNCEQVSIIAKNAFNKSEVTFEESTVKLISNYATNGRDTVNIVQTAVSVAALTNRTSITTEDIEEVIDSGRYSPNLNKKVSNEKRVGVVNGLAVFGGGGSILEIEANTKLALKKGNGKLKVTGIIEEEELNSSSGKMKRQSTAKSSVENVLTVINKITDLNLNDYDIHVNFPGGMPIDGPSAGISMFTAIYSSLLNKEVSSKIAMTGEISIKGRVNPVGGVASKIEAAVDSGITKVLIPKGNYQKAFGNYKIEIICLENINELLTEIFQENKKEVSIIYEGKIINQIMTASGN